MNCTRCGGSGEEPTNGRLSGVVLRGQAKMVLDFLNEKAGRNFQPTNVNVDLIASRLREGATVTQCKAVITRKVAQWKDTDWDVYLRPSTLFNATKFSQYQGELPASAFAKADG